MAKLTLNVDESVVARAKRYAARSGVSVSRLVEQLLALVSGGPGKGEDDLPLRAPTSPHAGGARSQASTR